jgi:hypothetical protein
LTVGVDHAEYTHTTRVHVGTVQLLLQDFDQQPHLVLN